MIIIGPIVFIFVQNGQIEDKAEDTPEDERIEHEDTSGEANGYRAFCKKCGWAKTYPDRVRAQKALGAHARFCKGKDAYISPFSRPFR